MPQIFPSDQDYSISAIGGTADEKIDSLVKQLNDHLRLLNNSFEQYKSESNIQMCYWFGSYKLSPVFTALNGSLTEINFDDWQGYDWYFECTGFTDAGTGHIRLYNITDDEVVEGSEFTTVAPDEDNAEYFRSGILTKYQGTKQFKIQLKIDNGNGTNEYVNCINARMVFRISS